MNTFCKIYRIIASIPAGKVATYGQIASLAGCPQNARVVGYALHALSPDTDIPWHRVVAKGGVINSRCARFGELEIQRILLEGEGVSFLDSQTVDMEKHCFNFVDIVF